MASERTAKRSRRALLAAGAAAAAVAVAPGNAHAAGCEQPRPIVRGTEIFTSGFRYLPGGDECGIPRLAVSRGSRLMYTNLDFAAHDVRSFALRSRTRSNRKRRKSRKLQRRSDEPLFTSELIRYLGRGEVVGVAALKPGTYGFYCTIHPPRQSGGGMHGTLVIEEVPR